MQTPNKEVTHTTHTTHSHLHSHCELESEFTPSKGVCKLPPLRVLASLPAFTAPHQRTAWLSTAAGMARQTAAATTAAAAAQCSTLQCLLLALLMPLMSTGPSRRRCCWCCGGGCRCCCCGSTGGGRPPTCCGCCCCCSGSVQHLAVFAVSLAHAPHVNRAKRPTGQNLHC
jgi:hypothetical protein